MQIAIVCLNELKKQQVIYEKVHDQKLMDDTVRKLDGLQKNIVINGDILIGITTGKVLSPEVDYNCLKEKC